MPAFRAMLVYSFRFFFRHRVFYMWAIFSLLFLGVSFVLSDLAVMQRQRVLVDLGLAAIELFVLFVALFFAVQLVGEDRSSGFSYLIFSHPVSPAAFIIGKFLGLVVALFMGALVLAVSLFIMLSFLSIPWQALFFYALLGSFFKLVLVSGFAVMLSLLFSSQAVAFVTSLLLYVVGHLQTDLLRFYEQTEGTLLKKLVVAFFFLLPDLEKYNVKDLLSTSEIPVASILWFMAHHTAIFLSIYLLVSIWAFSRQEL